MKAIATRLQAIHNRPHGRCTDNGTACSKQRGKRPTLGRDAGNVNERGALQVTNETETTPTPAERNGVATFER